MRASQKTHHLAGRSWARDLRNDVADLSGAYAAARRLGEDGIVERTQVQEAILARVPSGYYESDLDFMTLEPAGEPREIVVLGTAKNEVTHGFNVIVMLHGDACVPVPLGEFAEQCDAHIRFARAECPKHLLRSFMPLLSRQTKLGKCRHITSTRDDRREYHVFGSAVAPIVGRPMTLYHEHPKRFPAGMRIRDSYGDRGFKTVTNRGELRGERFPYVEQMRGDQVIAAMTG
jgi:hypothetical protein